MEPGVDDKTGVDWSLYAMGAAIVVAVAFMLAHLL